MPHGQWMGDPVAPLTAPQLVGFVLAAWAVVGNDALQTLGPFLEANRGRTPRPWQGLYLGGVLCLVLLLGWILHGGDASWGRLERFPLPAHLGWSVLLAPLAVLLLTRLGAPVSTSFLVLIAFQPANLPALLRQSLLGYGLALVLALGVYGTATALARWRWGDTPSPAQTSPGPAATPAATAALGQPAVVASDPSVARARPLAEAPSSPGMAEAADAPDAAAGGGAARWALALQWAATGWLWGQWLIQDLANIYVYLPRRLGPSAMVLSLLVLCGGIALLLAERGGAIQGILRRKRDLEDPRATTAVSLLYGLVLSGFAAVSHQPMSTTWVFLGLLAGRELALLLRPDARPRSAVARDLGLDLLLAGLGLAVSLAVALAVQPLHPAG